jgi:AAHS family 4-hydroxybenzoate transporter-like MFS transporter
MIPGLPAEPPVRDTTAARSGARVSRLFEPATRVDTSLLWAYAFLIFSASYTLISWSPTLMISYGFSRTEAPLGLAFVSLGGIIGGLVLMPVAARIGIMRALILLPALGAVFMVIAAQVPMGDAGMLLVLALSGIGVIAGHIGQTALAVALYPVETRTTGVGWAAALGRGGSLAGPAAAGALLALALSASNIIMAAIVPIIAAILCALALWRRNRSAQRPAAPEPGPARVEKGVSGGR